MSLFAFPQFVAIGPAPWRPCLAGARASAIRLGAQEHGDEVARGSREACRDRLGPLLSQVPSAPGLRVILRCRSARVEQRPERMRAGTTRRSGPRLVPAAIPRLKSVMAIYLVDCALRDAGHDYATFWQAMERANAVRALESTWLIDVDQTIEEVHRSVLTLLHPTDQAFIVELTPVTRWVATHLFDDAKAWLKARSGARPPPPDLSGSA